MTPKRSAPQRLLAATEFDALYERLRRNAVWGSDDRRGALNHITSDRVLAAVREVRLGRTASLAAPVEGDITADNPEPAVHEMTGLPTGEDADPTGLSFAMDRLRMNVHGNADGHIDALCHVIYRAHLYNGVPADRITASGATELSIDVTRDGIVGRGVLLDIPRLRGVGWLEPGDHVTSDDLSEAELAQGVRVGEGDSLFVRVGHRKRRAALGPWDSASSRAGLHPTALDFVAHRRVAVLGSMATTTLLRAPPNASRFPSMSWPLMHWVCSSWIVSNSRSWCHCARLRTVGPFYVLLRRCESPEGQGHRSTRSRFCKFASSDVRHGPARLDSPASG